MESERPMTKDVVLKMATKLLYNICDNDFNCIAKIAYADAEAREGKKEGYDTIVDALRGARDFIDELITKIKHTGNEDCTFKPERSE